MSLSQEPHYESEETLFPPSGDDEILKLTMGVVKSVKELSDKVHKSKPNDYIDLVKVCESYEWRKSGMMTLFIFAECWTVPQRPAEQS